MKYFKIIAAIIVLSFAFCCSAQSAPKPKKYIIIEDYIFGEMPVPLTEIQGVSFVSTPNGNKATCFTLKNALPAEAVAYALPIDSVPEGAELIERFKESKINSLSISEEKTLLPGTRFPDFEATDIDGRKWTNADVAGKPMVLNLWFTGCGPCRAEMPELSQWKDEMPDIMFFSATYESAERARPVLEKQGFNWIALVNDTQFKGWIGTQGYPMTILVDKTGTVTHVEYGTSPIQRDSLKQKIAALR